MAYFLENKHNTANSNGEDSAIFHTSSNLNDYAIQYFKNIVDLCKQKDISLILVITPSTDNYSKTMIDEYTKEYDKFMLINYFHDTTWQNNEDNFYDADHLSTFEAIVFRGL